MFLYSNLVYFFFIIYVQIDAKPFYTKYHKIIHVLLRQLTSLSQRLKQLKNNNKLNYLIIILTHLINKIGQNNIYQKIAQGCKSQKTTKWQYL